MSCCGKNADELAKELEEKVNANGKDAIPLFLKIVLAAIGIGAVTLYFI